MTEDTSSPAIPVTNDFSPPRRSVRAKAPPPPKPKSAAKAKGLPTWQGPRPSVDWKAERVVNWQPIRNEARWSGSVWEKIHNSMNGQVSLPPDKVLERFMTKPSESKTSNPMEGAPRKVQVERILSRQNALIADIHHALLSRKGFNNARHLCWVLGPLVRESSESDETTPLPEDVLEAVYGLLDAAMSAEKLLHTASEDIQLVRTETFLRQILDDYGPFDVLQNNVRMALNMLHFPSRSDELERELSLALCAATGVMHSTAMPVLLEGCLVLGNSVNSSSKNLGGAVGVTLESLAKLANTKCLSDKKGGKQETALLVLVQYLQEGCPDLTKNLAQDLDACCAARDFDQKVTFNSVDELSSQLDALEKRLLATATGPEETPAVPAALAESRLEVFLAEAKIKLTLLRELVDELEDATDELRRWFAESSDCTLASMLQSLAALRVALPISRPAVPTLTPKPKRTEGARPRRPRDKRTSVQLQAKVEEPAIQGVVSQCDQSQPEPSVDSTSREHLHAQPQAAIVEEHVVVSQDIAPQNVVAQILSPKRGTVWVSWFFDWAALPQKFSSDACNRSFEVSQQRGDCSQRYTWHCEKPPLKLELLAGFHYVFNVRAYVHNDSRSLDSNEALEQTLWVSSPSNSVEVDLRIPENAIRSERNCVFSVAAKTCDSPVSTGAKPDKYARRSRVASNIGAFLKDPSSPSSITIKDQQETTFASVSTLAPMESRSGSNIGSIRSEETAVDNPLQLLIRTLSVLPDELESTAELEHDLIQSTPKQSFNQDDISENAEVIGAESDTEDLKQLALAFEAIERISMQASVVKEESPVDVKDAQMSSMATGKALSRDSEFWEHTISDKDASALRQLARALSIMDFDTSFDSSSNLADGSELGSPTQHIHTGEERMSKGIDDDLPDGNEVFAAMQRHYSGVSVQSNKRADELPDGNDVLAAMQRHYSEQSTQSLQRHYSEQSARSSNRDTSANTSEPPLGDNLVDGNEVLAAMEQKLKHDRCRLCGGTGKVGLLGTTGLGFMTKPCECVAQEATSSVRNPFGQAANLPSRIAQSTKIPFTSNISSFAQSTTSKMPFLSAPLWAASRSFKLRVRLSESRVEVLEFQDARVLPKRVEDFCGRHNLLSRFSQPLKERAEGMVRYEVYEDSVDIVDLV